MAVRPEVSSLAEELYAALGPWARADTIRGEAGLGYDLLTLCEGVMGRLQPVEDIIRDTDEGPGWSSVVDANRSPEEWLKWLGQFNGVRLRDGIPEAEARSRIKDSDGFKRGTVGAIKAAIRRIIGPNAQPYLIERDGSAYRLTVSITEGDLEYTHHENLAKNPHGEIDLTDWDVVTNVFPGATISRVADATLGDAGYEGSHVIRVEVIGSGAWWGASYHAGGFGFLQDGHTYTAVWLLKGEDGGEDLIINIGGPGGPYGPVERDKHIVLTDDWAVYSQTFTPDSGRTGDFGIRTNNNMTGAWRIGGLLIMEEPAPTDYFDGDYPNHEWEGTPHASKSQTVPNEVLVANVREAILEQKPAGIVLNYGTVVGGTFDTLRDSWADFDAVETNLDNFYAVREHPDTAS